MTLSQNPRNKNKEIKPLKKGNSPLFFLIPTLALTLLTSLLFIPTLSHAKSESFLTALHQSERKAYEEEFSLPPVSAVESELESKLKKAFSKFIFKLLNREIELENISFDSETQNYLDDEASLTPHVKVKPDDIIDNSPNKKLNKHRLWVKPYVRDFYFHTRSMACRYSYRSKFKKQSRSLSGHYVHQNHGELSCKDSASGSKVIPYVFGKKSMIFIAGLTPSQNMDFKFETSDLKRNITAY